MFSHKWRVSRLVVAAVACLALLVIGAAAVTAAPSNDEQGFIDSSARCATPDVAVVVGSTDSSRVAICQASGGQYEYRGVRMRDGATLTLPASEAGDGGFVAENDGVVYTVTAKSLVISTGQQVLREEPMTYFRGPEAPTTTTPTTPLPPPLPAEVGGDSR